MQFVVHRQYKPRQRRRSDYFETEQQAMAEFDVLRPEYREGRVWVVDQKNNKTIADSRAK